MVLFVWSAWVYFGLLWGYLFGRFWIATVVSVWSDWAVLDYSDIPFIFLILSSGKSYNFYQFRFRFVYFYFSTKIWYYYITNPPFHIFQIYSSFSNVTNPALRYMSRVGTAAITS